MTIFKDLINGKLPSSQVEDNLKNKLTISDDLSKKFYETIKESLSEIKTEETEKIKETSNNNSSFENKNSIFSALLK